MTRSRRLFRINQFRTAKAADPGKTLRRLRRMTGVLLTLRKAVRPKALSAISLSASVINDGDGCRAAPASNIVLSIFTRNTCCLPRMLPGLQIRDHPIKAFAGK